MKQFIVTMLAAAMVVNATAQSLEDGMKMYRYERYASAKKILQPLAAGDPQANYYYGLSELALGNTDAAMNAFVKYPEDYANISGTVRVKFATQGAEAGMQAANTLADMGKKKEWMQKRYAAAAVTYSKGGDLQKAVGWWEEVLEKMVTPELLISAGDAYQQLPSGGGKAMTDFEKAVEKDPKNSLAYSRIGKLMYNAKNYEVALENWKKAQEADPENPLPYYDMANAYTYVGKYDIAKENIEKYMQHSDKSTEDMIRYAEILFLAKDFPAAIQKVNELKDKGVNRPNFYGILGYAYLEDKDSISGVKSLENLRSYFAKQDPKKLYTLDYLTLGRAYLRNNMGDSANIAFNKALSMDSTDNKVSTYREIAESFRTLKSWNNAGQWYEKIYKDYEDKATPTDYFWGGYSYYLAANMPDVDTTAMLIKADTIYGSMIAKFPDQPSGYYWRGRVKAAQDSEGKEGIAAPYFEQWLDLDVEGAKKSDRDLQFAYQYLTACYYYKEDWENTRKYCDLVLQLDAKNPFATQIKELIKGKK
ncbi:MAG: hypothetical protein H6550_00335 [Chitinophagales bacterium]|nr:hypothetical protein [Chitinophagales bacterium]